MTEPNDMPYELESLLRADGAAAQRLIAQAIETAAVAQVKPLRGKRYAWLLVAALVITGSAAAMYAAQRGGDVPQHTARPRPIAHAPQIAAQEPLAEGADLTQGEAQKPELAAPALPAPATDAEPVQAESGAGQVQDLLRRANRSE